MTRKQKVDATDVMHEMAVPISSQTHLYIRATNTQVIIEAVSHTTDEAGVPVDLNGSILYMSPEQFAKLTKCFAELIERLSSQQVH